MSARFMLCNECDGSKVDPNGHKCPDCFGAGGFVFGENREVEAIEADLESTRQILSEEIECHKKASEAVKTAKREQKNGMHLNVTMSLESIAFYEAMLSAYEKELAESKERAKGCAPLIQ